MVKVSQIYNIHILSAVKGLQKVNISNTPFHYPTSASAVHRKTDALISAF